MITRKELPEGRTSKAYKHQPKAGKWKCQFCRPGPLEKRTAEILANASFDSKAKLELHLKLRHR